MTHPELAWQQLANRLQWSHSTAALVPTWFPAANGNRPLPLPLRLRTRPRESEALLRRLDHGTRWLSACAFVPGTDLLVAACTDRTLQIWDVPSGRPVRVLGGMPASPQSCAATPDGKFVLATTGNPAGTLHLWETHTGRHIASVNAHEPSCTACTVVPDGSQVVTFGTDHQVRRWTLPGLRPVGQPITASEPLTCGALSPDGAVLIYGGRQGVLHVRGPAGVDAVELVHEHGVPLTGCAVGVGGRPVATCGEDGRLVIWDLSSGRGVDTPAITTPIVDCAVSADGSLVAAASDDGRIHLWELPAVAPVGVLEAHTTTVVATVLSPDGDTVASVSGDGTVCLWSVAAATGAALGGHTGLVEHATFTRDGSALLTTSSDGTTRTWDTATGAEIGAGTHHPGGTARLLNVEDNLVVAAGEQGTLLLVDHVAHTVEADRRRSAPVPVVVGEHGSQVWDMTPLPGDRVVTAGADGSCRVWNLRERVTHVSYPGDGAPVLACAAAADGSFVASAGGGGNLHIWHPASGEALLIADEHASSIRAVAVSLHGDVVTVNALGTVTLRSPGNRWEPHVLGRDAGGALQTPVQWTASGSIVTGAADGTIAVYPGRGQVWRRRAHDGPVHGLAASPSGRLIATGGADRMLVLWNSETGDVVSRLPCAGRVHQVAFHPTEPVIACTGDGGFVCITELVGGSVTDGGWSNRPLP
ncbi:WD40 repeat domain-containing protein [Saccharothrix variisporea]|uniref:WD40 repeat domain-containing protein n=1 Tax=Saccharothrix variisporea TaxID=543527 RepID=UPI0014769E03|nr:hypothetical protein [Saccharothrix variisporea]